MIKIENIDKIEEKKKIREDTLNIWKGVSIPNYLQSKDYYGMGRAYEPRKVIRDWGLNFNLGSAIKYIARNGRKNPEKDIEDLEKAITYLQFEIEAIREEESC